MAKIKFNSIGKGCGNLPAWIDELHQWIVKPDKVFGLIDEGKFPYINRKFGFESVNLYKVVEMGSYNIEGVN